MLPYSRADPALWRWLPHGEDLFEPWRRHLAMRIAHVDPMFALREWRHPAYDPAAGRVLYYQGCCAWQETVLARVRTAPPHAVPRAALATLRTPRGIGLGATVGAVRRAYGAAPLHASSTTAGLRVLSYYEPLGPSNCGRFENFVFSRGVLVEVQAGDGC